MNTIDSDGYPLMHLFVQERQELRVAYRKLLLEYNVLYSNLETLNSTLEILLTTYGSERREQFLHATLEAAGTVRR